MIRRLSLKPVVTGLCLLIASLSWLLASRAEAVPFSFGASINTVGFIESEGRVVSTFNIPFIGVLPQDRPLLLTLPPDPVVSPSSSSSNTVFDMSAVVVGNLSLLLQNGDGAVLGGYRFVRRFGENSNAQYVVCAGPNNCVSEFGRALTNPPLTLFAPPSPLFDWPVVSPELMDSIPSCPFGPPFCVTQGFGESSHLVIPSMAGGNLMATVDFSTHSVCFQSPCPSNSSVTFTLDGLEPVPEPATLILWGTTAAGLGWLARRKAKTARAEII